MGKIHSNQLFTRICIRYSTTPFQIRQIKVVLFRECISTAQFYEQISIYIHSGSSLWLEGSTVWLFVGVGENNQYNASLTNYWTKFWFINRFWVLLAFEMDMPKMHESSKGKIIMKEHKHSVGYLKATLWSSSSLHTGSNTVHTWTNYTTSQYQIYKV
jgi:hypothetical protein